MYVDVYVCIYILDYSTLINRYIHAYTQPCTYIQNFTYIHINMDIQIFSLNQDIYTYIYIQIYIHTYTSTCIQIFSLNQDIYTYIHINIYTYIHINIHTNIQP
jgi:hypothetical protein